MERPKTQVDRIVEVDGKDITINSTVKETMDVEFFFDQNKQKVQQLGNLQQQLAGTLAQIKNLEGKLPEISIDSEQGKELMELKEKINMIRSLDQISTLKTNAQKFEVDISILEKDVSTFKDVQDKLESTGDIDKVAVNKLV